MNSLAPDSTEVFESDAALDAAIAAYKDHIGPEWRPGDIDAASLEARFKAQGQRVSRSTLGKWLQSQYEAGVYERIEGVIHPKSKRRVTVFRPIVPALPAAAGRDGVSVRGQNNSVHKSGMSAPGARNRKGKKTP